MICVGPSSIWVWAGSRSWWWRGRPGILQSKGSQRVRHDWATELIDPQYLSLFWVRFCISFHYYYYYYCKQFKHIVKIENCIYLHPVSIKVNIHLLSLHITRLFHSPFPSLILDLLEPTSYSISSTNMLLCIPKISDHYLKHSTISLSHLKTILVNSFCDC